MKKTIGILLLLGVTNFSFSQEMMSQFFDPRDGQEYETVLIELEYDGTTSIQEWMTTNLNYASEDSYCYHNYQQYCDAFGRLYPWKEAVKVCPAGWHLTRNIEWEMVMAKYGGIKIAGPALKDGGESSINLQSAGFGEPNGAYIDVGVDGYYWKQEKSGSSVPGTITVHSGVQYLTDDAVDETHFNSVRCVKDY